MRTIKRMFSSRFFALGCARAGLDILEAAANTKQLPFLHNSLQLPQHRTYLLSGCHDASFATRLSVLGRTTATASLGNQLALRCASAAVTASSGAANYRYHAAQRVYREALVFTVSGQTTAVMEATLEQLVE
jgi:hypothetical protein